MQTARRRFCVPGIDLNAHPLYGEPEPAFLRHFRQQRRLGRVTGFGPMVLADGLSKLAPS
jgi:hypothetical protein